MKKINSKQLIKILSKSCKNKSQKDLPLFTTKETNFIIDLIFNKSDNLAYLYLIEDIVDSTDIGKPILFNSMNYKRYLFLINYFKCKGNATRAAILSGYSYKSAKQQGHRILKEIQNMSKIRWLLLMTFITTGKTRK